MVAGPFKPVSLPLALDHHATLTRTFGHRHRNISRVNVAVRRMVNRTFQIFGSHQRIAVFDLRGRQPLIRHAAGLGGGRIEHVLIHPRIGLCHAQIANHRKARVQTGLVLKRFVKLDRIVMNMRRRIAHVEIGQQTRRMPGGAGCQLVPLQQHDILPPRAREMIGNRGANSAAADNQSFDVGFHGAILQGICPM